MTRKKSLDMFGTVAVFKNTLIHCCKNHENFTDMNDRLCTYSKGEFIRKVGALAAHVVQCLKHLNYLVN